MGILPLATFLAIYYKTAKNKNAFLYKLLDWIVIRISPVINPVIVKISPVVRWISTEVLNPTKRFFLSIIKREKISLPMQRSLNNIRTQLNTIKEHGVSLPSIPGRNSSQEISPELIQDIGDFLSLVRETLFSIEIEEEIKSAIEDMDSSKKVKSFSVVVKEERGMDGLLESICEN